jgi:hypothetical protein
MTVSGSSPCWRIAPHSAPSLAIWTGSGVTFSPVSPSA